MVATLDNLIWSLWKAIAPKSVVQRDPGENFRRTIGRYLGGDREVATLQITQRSIRPDSLWPVSCRQSDPPESPTRDIIWKIFAPERDPGVDRDRCVYDQCGAKVLAPLCDPGRRIKRAGDRKADRRHNCQLRRKKLFQVENEASGASPSRASLNWKQTFYAGPLARRVVSFAASSPASPAKPE